MIFLSRHPDLYPSSFVLTTISEWEHGNLIERDRSIGKFDNPLLLYTEIMKDATPAKYEYESLLEAFAFWEMKKISLAVYQIKDNSTYHIMTWKHTNDNAPTVCILYLHDLQHYQALLCQSPLDIQTFNDSTTSVSKSCLSSITNT